MIRSGGKEIVGAGGGKHGSGLRFHCGRERGEGGGGLEGKEELTDGPHPSAAGERGEG